MLCFLLVVCFTVFSDIVSNSWLVINEGLKDMSEKEEESQNSDTEPEEQEETTKIKKKEETKNKRKTVHFLNEEDDEAHKKAK